MKWPEDGVERIRTFGKNSKNFKGVIRNVEEVLEFDPLQVYGTINHSDQVDEFNADYKK